jgi:7-carboxy-7-deazaguanine synthase
MSKELVLPVSELFGGTIQGEGPMVGRRTLFVRFAGCDYKCSWCDSKHTWQPPIVKEMMSEEQILEWMNRKRKQTGVGSVVLSGGNPALYDLTHFINVARFGFEAVDPYPWQIAVETQGSRAQTWFEWVNWLVISPKPPSSGMDTDMEALAACLRAGSLSNTYLKVVIFTDEDYEYAKVINRIWPQYPLYLSIGTFAPERGREGQSVQPKDLARDPVRDTQSAILARTTKLAERVMQDKGWANDPHVLPQMHVLMWGHLNGV